VIVVVGTGLMYRKEWCSGTQMQGYKMEVMDLYVLSGQGTSV
jgi:hypothetical protein